MTENILNRSDFELWITEQRFTTFTGEGAKVMKEIFDRLNALDDPETMPVLRLIAQQCEVLRLGAFGIGGREINDRDCSKFIVRRATIMVAELLNGPMVSLTKDESDDAHKLLWLVDEETMLEDKSFSLGDIRRLLGKPQLTHYAAQRIGWQAAELGLWWPEDDGTFYKRRQFEPEMWDFVRKRFMRQD